MQRGSHPRVIPSACRRSTGPTHPEERPRSRKSDIRCTPKPPPTTIAPMCAARRNQNADVRTASRARQRGSSSPMMASWPGCGADSGRPSGCRPTSSGWRETMSTSGTRESSPTIAPSVQSASRQPNVVMMTAASSGQMPRPTRLPLTATAVANVRRRTNQFAMTVCPPRFWMPISAVRPTENMT